MDLCGGTVSGVIASAARGDRSGPANRVDSREALSGTIEALLALIALIYWYSYSVAGWAQQAIFSTIKAHPEAAIREYTVGFAAMTLMAMHPLTWAIAWFGVEGILRALGAAFAGNVNGSFPLWALNRIVQLFRPSRGEKSPALGENAASFVEAIRQSSFSTRTPVVPDEICVSMDGPEELLEIRSCRPKEDWDPPRVVRYEGIYYRLKCCYRGGAPRPFHFYLRKLPAGVPGRTAGIFAGPDTDCYSRVIGSNGCDAAGCCNEACDLRVES
jgi:hypothetical protein